jgi:adenosylhomocysteine nucleosidase
MGLLAEARIAARSANVKTVVSGGNATRLADLIEDAIAEGGRAIVSFGIAGALSEGLKPGTCLVGNEVVHAGKLYRAEPAWATRLENRLTIARFEGLQNAREGNAESGSSAERKPALHRIAGVDRPLSIPCDKRALNATTGAAAADMESHIVAALAARHRLPFAVVRTIADPVSRGIPQAAVVGMRSDGAMNAIACLRHVVREPAELPALVRLAVDTSRAMLQLLRCVKVLGPGLGFFERG